MEKRPPLILSTREGYDLWAEIYDTEGNPLVLLEEPHIARLLGDVRGLYILDAGCGTGRHTLRLAEAGANVTGLDFSEGMLTKAREKAGESTARFIHHDIANRLPFERETFDRVLCCLALDHVSDLPAFFSELRRVCRPTGFIVTSVMHPAMMLKGVQARFRDPSTGLEIRPESSPHQISSYVMAAVRSGLRLDEVSEHAVDASLVSQTPRAERYVGWPMLLIMKLIPAKGE